jgi:DNA mismatch repair protein MSH5
MSLLTKGPPPQMASTGAIIDHLVREQAMSDFDDEGTQGLEVREIEILTL